ncbi:hypothetical protein DAPPUDRAFT_314032 [Daphnia pulex]|uniref:MYND-type domain-containing protein n=1 Tax=Daphnia pulex TaxID=6669 RepID=E9G4H6_DAPPU|nr:hypothetical protein DAPPUDRAFT_314032 [Daphnia pulex]|eukprot:EFX85304.1 hypothetical protein DAPPUDRAFT_314032 [Daphnia pulex]
MSWDSASCKLAFSEGSGQKELKMIEYVVAEGRCANCKKTSPNLKLCSRCLSISYCCKECQRSDWSNHKTVCQKK